MHHRLWFLVGFLVSLVGLVALERGALAQGVTGSAVTGTVTAEGGGPIEGAALQLRNQSNGLTFTAVSDATGQYFFDNIPPGGPYVLTAKAPGYVATTEGGVQTILGQRLTVDVQMKGLGEEIVVVAPQRTVLNDRGRTGASTIMRESTITELPLSGRDFVDLISNDPRVNVNSIAGQNNRFNNIQIDGGANNDLFGLADNGTPGGQANAKPLSIEAVKEFVVQVSPFDVRQGNFAGGLVNAITKSGTNEFHGTVFGYYQNKTLSNTNYYTASGEYKEDPNYLQYYSGQFGASLGGPIIPDKVHFFAAVDIQQRQSPFGSIYNISGTSSADDIARAGFDLATAQRFMDILSNKWGITNAGNAFAPSQGNPDRNVFIKLTTSVIENSDLELSYNFVNAHRDVLIRAPTNPSIPFSLRDGYQLSNSGYAQANSTNTVRAKLTTNWLDGKLSNEFLAGVSIIRDARELPVQAPLILVKVGTLGGSDSWLAAGEDRFSQANILDQDVWQVGDNLTYGIEKHRLTLGSSNEFFKFRNVFFQAATGVYAFDCLTTTPDCANSFEAGMPHAFQRRLGVSPLQEPGTAAFSVAQLGFYVQDEWSPVRNFRLTPGLRIDVPFLSKANTNPNLVNNAAFPIDTSKVPSGNILWSPRLGFNWDVTSDAMTIVRGGTGVFSGRPPYVWVSNAYSINGLSQVELTCLAPNVPAFTPDPKNQPATCAGGTGPVAPVNQGEIDYFDPNTKYPQNWRVALGVDRRLPWGIIGTVDLLYTQDVNGWYTTEENLVRQADDGDGRAIYGTLRDVGVGTPPLISSSPTRIDSTNLTQAVKVFNKNGGKVYSATIQLQKTFAKILDVSVAYTYSKSEDRISLTSSQALSNFRFEPIDGSIADRSVRPSAFDRPHKITVTGFARLPYGFGLGLTYVGRSGTPYTWVVKGDVNGDGIDGNDLVFVPANPSQISLQDASQWDALNNFIQSQDCLRDARGHFIQRGACRNPWLAFVDMRLSWVSPDIVKGQHFELQYDIFNLMNLLNSKWGHWDEATPFETHGQTFLRAVGYDRANNRPLYTFTQPSFITQTIYSGTQSRWRMQLGLRYIF